MSNDSSYSSCSGRRRPEHHPFSRSADHTSTPSEDFTSPRVKFMCSYGGKILPRPGDGRLRYVGGDTRIITVNRDINHAELVSKMTETYNQHDLTIKYQLPDEDLDALISISSDEDLVNMMEEYDKIERSDGCARLRVFLFSAHVPVALPVSSIPGVSSIQPKSRHSAPSSAPSSPPLLARPAKQVVVPDIHHHNFQEQHPKGADVRVPRVHSHGMLTRLSEQHLEGGANTRPESQQLPDMALPPLDLQRRGLHQQHPPGGQQQSQVHRAFNGTNYVEQQHGRRVHPYNDQPSRSFRSSNSPPRYRDHQVHSEERFMRSYHQQTSVNSDQLPHEHVYESNSISQTSYPESVARPQLPHYISQNPYQEGLSGYQDHQDNGEGRWHLFQGKENLALKSGHQHFHPPYYSTRVDYQDQGLPPIETLSAPQQPSSMISGNVDLPSIVRLEGAVQAYERSGTLDRPPRLPGAIVVQDRLSRPTSGTNVSTLEEESNKGFVGMQAGLSGRQGSDELSEDLMELLDQGLFSQHSVDAQFDNSQYAHATSQMQLPLPSAIKLNTNPIPTVKASVSTESSNMTASVQLPPVYCSTTAGSAVPAYAPTSMVSPAMREGETVSTTAPPATLLSHGEISGSAVRKADTLQHEDKASLSQLYATGHLAEDMASSVLGSVTKEVEQIHNDGLEDEKEEWMHISQDPSSMVRAPLVTSPTFAIQDWEKDLAELDSDEDESIQEPLAEEKASALQISNLETIKNADLEEMRELGSGTFGTVYHGKWRGSDVAIKRIKASCFAGRPSEQERLIADFWREACILGQLHHPNVVAFYGVVRDGPGGTLATVTEYMVNGSLKQVLQKKDRTIDRRKRLLIAMDAAFGMEYLHGKNIVHFDMKCENLLVNMRDPHRPVCKVGDLGLSKVKHQTMVSGGVRGTLPWMAPELLNGNSNMVTEKVDVFSFGIVMWELLTGEEPYASMHYGAIIGGIVNNTLRPKIPSWCDPTWKSLMERCWSADPADRPTFSVIASELRAMAVAIQPKGHG
ncbi:unnamed protein product [Sphagnum jensenii]|uniref:Protein kinase domain-containing protein n=1 Tax=Sphagnum jensenii TaxID=128206 RepID=A0ABP1C1Z2_9BRYO